MRTLGREIEGVQGELGGGLGASVGVKQALAITTSVNCLI